MNSLAQVWHYSRKIKEPNQFTSAVSSQKSPEDPEEETVEQSLSKQSEVEKQSRRSQVVYLMAP